MSNPLDQSDMSDDSFEPNILDDEDDWKDVEPDRVGASFVSFGGTARFRELGEFLVDAKENYGVDLIEIKNLHDLDTFGMIKLINYVRGQVNQGLFRPNLLPKNFLEGDEYLKPVIEDDALLYSIDDIFDYCEQQKKSLPNGSVEAALSREEVQDLLRQNKQLREQAIYYRSALQKTYLENLELKQHPLAPLSEQGNKHDAAAAPTREIADDDSHYFSSYAYNDVHELMLQDTVRTDAYRDFIYENKHLFAGKVVLDVGCGTGILSLFCAKAGAAKVIAVDNSSIIDKAREIVFENGLSETIQCLRGKVEDVTLPVNKVDIIVSEWMGYCLLYEAMLDSVIWARDHYLDRNGLMVPSHATIQLSLFADDDYISDKFTFWNSVYGFKMSCMLAKAYDDIVIRTVKPAAVPSSSKTVVELPLHTVKKEDLTLSGTSFQLDVEQNVDQLHGFLIHFNICFATSREANISDAPTYFTTGPLGPETHWQQALALIDTSKHDAANLLIGGQVSGSIKLRKGIDNFRELQIEIDWRVQRSKSDAKQSVSETGQIWTMHDRHYVSLPLARESVECFHEHGGNTPATQFAMAPDRGSVNPDGTSLHEDSSPRSGSPTTDFGKVPTEGDDTADELPPVEEAQAFLAQQAEQAQNFTLRGTLVGLGIGVIICFSNTYFGLQTGWVSGMTMPAALIGFAFFKTVSKHLELPFTPVENVLVQTVAGATGTMPLGCGFVGVMPALNYLLKPEEHGPLQLPAGKLILWSLGLSFFGVVFAVPLRKEFIIREKLKFPSGTATALVISVLHGGGDDARIVQHECGVDTARRRSADVLRSKNRSEDMVRRSSSISETTRDAAGNYSAVPTVMNQEAEPNEPGLDPGQYSDWKSKIRLLAMSFGVSAVYVRFVLHRVM
ncbi:MAG: hypothetical protein Q9216_000163 [Gyalolechia sp. 2 TL-2023]